MIFPGLAGAWGDFPDPTRTSWKFSAKSQHTFEVNRRMIQNVLTDPNGSITLSQSATATRWRHQKSMAVLVRRIATKPMFTPKPRKLEKRRGSKQIYMAYHDIL